MNEFSIWHAKGRRKAAIRLFAYSQRVARRVTGALARAAGQSGSQQADASKERKTRRVSPVRPATNTTALEPTRCSAYSAASHGRMGLCFVLLVMLLHTLAFGSVPSRTRSMA